LSHSGQLANSLLHSAYRTRPKALGRQFCCRLGGVRVVESSEVGSEQALLAFLVVLVSVFAFRVKGNKTSLLSLRLFYLLGPKRCTDRRTTPHSHTQSPDAPSDPPTLPLDFGLGTWELSSLSLLSIPQYSSTTILPPTRSLRARLPPRRP
jgi:hypothetical protein